MISGQPENKINVTVGMLEYGNAMLGKTVLITGGNSGIGLCVAKKCLNEGAKVVITGRNEKSCIEACDQLGENLDYVICDFNRPEGIEKMMKVVIDKLGHIDYLLCNAGTSYYEKTIFDVTSELWDAYMNVNLKSVYFVVQEYLKTKSDNEEGAIVFTSSDWAFFGDGADKPYPIMKGALNSLTQGLSCSFYKSGIRVNAVAPGETATKLTGFSAEKDLTTNRKCGRRFIPEEIAEVIFFLLSDASKCISGQVIVCDGGDFVR